MHVLPDEMGKFPGAQAFWDQYFYEFYIFVYVDGDKLTYATS